MNTDSDNGAYAEKHANGSPGFQPAVSGKRDSYSAGADPEIMIATSKNALHQDLKGRHMQMIAMQVQHSHLVSMLTYTYSGGAIGAGLFIGSGGAFQTGGPGAVLLGFMIVGTLYAIKIATW